jgi:hypothetical protein
MVSHHPAGRSEMATVCHVVVALVMVGVLVWGGATLLLDAWWRRWDRPDLADRPMPYPSVADEAQHWLDQPR